MNSPLSFRKNLPVMGLSLVAVALLAAIYLLPTWWVSLQAPNYPPESFPDGVRIHFHMNGVFNGCRKVDKEEIYEEQALDCVHEMDTINHYVGMYPIAAGGVVERAMSPFLVAMLGVMLLGFACSKPGVRLALMGTGFGAIALWMALTFFSEGGIAYQNTGYLEAMVTSMDQEGANPLDEAPATGIIARLKAEMAAVEARETGRSETAPVADETRDQAKQRFIESLRATYERDLSRGLAGADTPWHGDGRQVMLWHYEKSLGRYFNVPELIKPMVGAMGVAFHVVFFAIIGAMLVLLYGAWRGRGPLFWLLAAVPALLPVFFLVDYSAWLWWYGHNLSDMGAFTVKPFMPTVFGDGKVAQFSTHSYPHVGFGLMLALSAVVGAMVVLRRRTAGAVKAR